VYASDNATPTINGTTIPMIGGSTLEVLVQSITSTSNVFVIGQKKNIPPQIID